MSDSETMDEVRAKTDAINRAEPIVQREVFELFEATQSLGLQNAGLQNSLQMARAVLSEPDDLRQTVAICLAQVGIVESDPIEQYALDYATTDRLLREFALHGLGFRATRPVR